jgi:hypothetical protein
VTQDIRETLSDNPKRQKKIKRKRKRKRIRQRQLALTHILYQVVTYKVKLRPKKKKKKQIMLLSTVGLHITLNLCNELSLPKCFFFFPKKKNGV